MKRLSDAEYRIARARCDMSRAAAEPMGAGASGPFIGRGGPDADKADAYFAARDAADARAPLARELDGIHQRILWGVIAVVSLVVVMGSALIATGSALKAARADRLHWARVAEWEWAERVGCHVRGTRPSECADVEAGAVRPVSTGARP